MPHSSSSPLLLWIRHLTGGGDVADFKQALAYMNSKERRALLQGTDGAGNTLLLKAVEFSQPAWIECLIKMGAAIHHCNDSGLSLIDVLSQPRTPAHPPPLRLAELMALVGTNQWEDFCNILAQSKSYVLLSQLWAEDGKGLTDMVDYCLSSVERHECFKSVCGTHLVLSCLQERAFYMLETLHVDLGWDVVSMMNEQPEGAVGCFLRHISPYWRTMGHYDKARSGDLFWHSQWGQTFLSHVADTGSLNSWTEAAEQSFVYQTILVWKSEYLLRWAMDNGADLGRVDTERRQSLMKVLTNHFSHSQDMEVQQCLNLLQGLEERRMLQEALCRRDFGDGQENRWRKM